MQEEPAPLDHAVIPPLALTLTPAVPCAITKVRRGTGGSCTHELFCSKCKLLHFTILALAQLIEQEGYDFGRYIKGIFTYVLSDC